MTQLQWNALNRWRPQKMSYKQTVVNSLLCRLSWNTRNVSHWYVKGKPELLRIGLQILFESFSWTLFSQTMVAEFEILAFCCVCGLFKQHQIQEKVSSEMLGRVSVRFQSCWIYGLFSLFWPDELSQDFLQCGGWSCGRGYFSWVPFFKAEGPNIKDSKW